MAVFFCREYNVNMKKVIGSIILLFVLIGFLVWWLYVPRIKYPSGADYKNAIYTIENTEVMLNDGISEVPITPDSKSVVTTRYFGNEAHADLNADGVDDTVFLITQDTGGTATFYYVVVALSTLSDPTRVQGTNAILLGDRIAPQTTEIHGDDIVVNYADRVAGAAFTDNTSIGVTKRMKIINNKLIEIK